MGIFYILLIDVFVASAIFYIVFFSLVYYWHLKKTSFVVLPVIFAFEFFLAGFLTISIVSIVIYYLPQLLSLWR